jgi:hypothetical protein
MFADDGNLLHKIKEGYINYPEAQKLLGELRKGNALKEVRLVVSHLSIGMPETPRA